MERIICLIIGYLCGLCQTGYFYGLLKGTDLSKQGSGNTGATNTLRVLGLKAGVTVLIGDVLKCLLACTIARILYGEAQPDAVLLYVLYAGAGAILGHNFPFYRHFKGGKGIACTGALVIAVYDLRVFVITLAVFLGTVLLTRYVSLGSILGVSTFFLSFSAVTLMKLNTLGDIYRVEACMVVFAVAALGVIRHNANIGRLLAGTENKLGAKKQ